MFNTWQIKIRNEHGRMMETMEGDEAVKEEIQKDNSASCLETF
jgi:hypothetical protein